MSVEYGTILSPEQQSREAQLKPHVKRRDPALAPHAGQAVDKKTGKPAITSLLGGQYFVDKNFPETMQTNLAQPLDRKCAETPAKKDVADYPPAGATSPNQLKNPPKKGAHLRQHFRIGGDDNGDFEVVVKSGAGKSQACTPSAARGHMTTANGGLVASRKPTSAAPKVAELPRRGDSLIRAAQAAPAADASAPAPPAAADVPAAPAPAPAAPAPAPAAPAPAPAAPAPAPAAPAPAPAAPANPDVSQNVDLRTRRLGPDSRQLSLQRKKPASTKKPPTGRGPQPKPKAEVPTSALPASFTAPLEQWVQGIAVDSVVQPALPDNLDMSPPGRPLPGQRRNVKGKILTARERAMAAAASQILSDSDYASPSPNRRLRRDGLDKVSPPRDAKRKENVANLGSYNADPNAFLSPVPEPIIEEAAPPRYVPPSMPVGVNPLTGGPAMERKIAPKLAAPANLPINPLTISVPPVGAPRMPRSAGAAAAVQPHKVTTPKRGSIARDEKTELPPRSNSVPAQPAPATRPASQRGSRSGSVAGSGYKAIRPSTAQPVDRAEREVGTAPDNLSVTGVGVAAAARPQTAAARPPSVAGSAKGAAEVEPAVSTAAAGTGLLGVRLRRMQKLEEEQRKNEELLRSMESGLDARRRQADLVAAMKRRTMESSIQMAPYGPPPADWQPTTTTQEESKKAINTVLTTATEQPTAPVGRHAAVKKGSAIGRLLSGASSIRAAVPYSPSPSRPDGEVAAADGAVKENVAGLITKPAGEADGEDKATKLQPRTRPNTALANINATIQKAKDGTFGWKGAGQDPNAPCPRRGKAMRPTPGYVPDNTVEANLKSEGATGTMMTTAGERFGGGASPVVTRKRKGVIEECATTAQETGRVLDEGVLNVNTRSGAKPSYLTQLGSNVFMGESGDGAGPGGQSPLFGSKGRRRPRTAAPTREVIPRDDFDLVKTGNRTTTPVVANTNRAPSVKDATDAVALPATPKAEAVPATPAADALPSTPQAARPSGSGLPPRPSTAAPTSAAPEKQPGTSIPNPTPDLPPRPATSANPSRLREAIAEARRSSGAEAPAPTSRPATAHLPLTLQSQKPTEHAPSSKPAWRPSTGSSASGYVGVPGRSLTRLPGGAYKL